MFGVLLGIISAVRRNSAVDVGTMVVANVGVSMPVFWLGLMLAYVFALLLKDTPFWLPPSGRNSPGLSVPTLIEAWHLNVQAGTALYTFLTFISNMHLVNSLVTGNWAAFWDTAQTSDPARPGPGHDPHGADRPHDPLQPAGSAWGWTTSARRAPRA